MGEYVKTAHLFSNAAIPTRAVTADTHNSVKRSGSGRNRGLVILTRTATGLTVVALRSTASHVLGSL